ncbi:MAG: Fe-S protein assembly co-chaperone HscB [Pseudomonadota bacterium]
MKHPLDTNYFALFHLPVQFPLDGEILNTRYRELQRVIHPDRYAHASDQEKRLAQQHATLINDAYHTLRDDLKRAQYLLRLKGVSLEQRQVHDPGFLMEQMELREELAAIEQARDPARFDTLFKQIRQLEKNCKQALQESFATPERLEQACEAVVKLQFIRKLAEEAESLEERL